MQITRDAQGSAAGKEVCASLLFDALQVENASMGGCLRALTTLISVVVLSVSAAMGSNEDAMGSYYGPDAGRLVLSVAAYQGNTSSSYSLYFRRVADTSKTGEIRLGCFTCSDRILSLVAKPHYDFSDDSEFGDVKVLSLAPGDYEIFNFEVIYGGYMVRSSFKPDTPFSIPFTIKAGQTVYLGEFRAVELHGSNVIGMEVPYGTAKFQIFDEAKRDIAIAKSLNAAVFDPVIAIPDAVSPKSPFFERIP